VPVWGDCKDTLPLLTKLIQPKVYPEWLARFDEFKQAEEEACIKKHFKPEGPELSMAEVIDQLNELTGGNAIIVTDVGQHQMVACRYAHFNQSKSNITSGGAGTMGFALPAAIGAKFGAPEREVIAIIGDGGIQMTIQELGTIMQSEVDVKIIILNNRFLGMVRQWQQLFHEKRYSFVNIDSPDYGLVAQAYKIASGKVSERSLLKEALTSMFNHRGAYVLEVMVAREENVFPMVQSGCSVSEIRLK